MRSASKRRPVALAALAAVFALALAPRPADADDDYEVNVSGPPPIAVGGEGAIRVMLAPGPGLEISADGPVRISITAARSAGLRVPRTLYGRKHAVDPGAAALRFEISIHGEAAGRYKVDVDIRFWLCGSRTCRPVYERRQLEIVVEGGEPAPAPG